MGDKKKPVAQSEQEKITECMKAHVLGMIDGMKKHTELLQSAYKKYKVLANKQHEVIEVQRRHIVKLEAALEAGKKLIDIDEDIISVQRKHVKWQEKFTFFVIWFMPVLWNLDHIFNFGCRVWRHFFG